MIKILKDNNRVIIIVEDDGNIDMTQLTNNIISKAMEMSQPIQNNEVEGAEEYVGDMPADTMEDDSSIVLPPGAIDDSDPF